MNTQSIQIFNSSLIGVTNGNAFQWIPGGRTALVTNATTYSTGPNLQVQGPSGTWINVNSAMVADQLFVFDAPCGNYRMNCAASSVIGLNAVLVSVPYK